MSRSTAARIFKVEADMLQRLKPMVVKAKLAPRPEWRTEESYQKQERHIRSRGWNRTPRFS